MANKIRWTFAAGFAALVVLPVSAEDRPVSRDEVVAVVGGTALTAEELEQAGASRLFGFRTQE